MPNLSRINFFPFVLKDRASCHHLQLRQLRKAVNDAFSDTVRQVIDIWITILIIERQHGNAFLECRRIRSRFGALCLRARSNLAISLPNRVRQAVPPALARAWTQAATSDELEHVPF